jgi:hypothetical protein
MAGGRILAEALLARFAVAAGKGRRLGERDRVRRKFAQAEREQVWNLERPMAEPGLVAAAFRAAARDRPERVRVLLAELVRVTRAGGRVGAVEWFSQGMSIAADSVYTISPKMVLNIRANYHQLTDEYAADPALIGEKGIANLFPTNFWPSLYTFPQFFYPAFDVGPSTNRIGRPGREFWQHPQGYGGSARLNYYAGEHSLKFGGEYRVDRGKGARFEPITFNIKQALTANANSSPNLNTSGSEWATFMLGYIDNASIAARVPIQEAVTLGYAGYVMDDYKVNKNLTLNLGLRWEYEPGPVDRGNRISQQLDLTQPIPEFQTTPPAIPATVTNLLATKGEKQLFNGAWIFANDNGGWNPQKFLLMPRAGVVKIIDFGIAKIKHSAIAPTTAKTATAGTIGYMAPEQLSARPISQAADIYSLGVIAYEMVTGRRPFNPESPFELLEMQRAGVRVQPTDLRPSLPWRAQLSIVKALSFEPSQRQHTIREFTDELARALLNTEETADQNEGTARWLRPTIPSNERAAIPDQGDSTDHALAAQTVANFLRGGVLPTAQYAEGS